MIEWACDVKEYLNIPAQEGEETAEIYRREARAIYETAPLKAAVKLIDAAYANEHDEADREPIIRDLKTALALAPECGWIASCARRLLVKHGVWEEALAILEREKTLAPTVDLKIACMLEAADIAWIVLDDPARAEKWVTEALQADPTHVGALYHALWLDCACEDRQGAADAAEALAKILGDPEERAVLFALAANTYLALGDDALAHARFSQAVQADRKHVFALLGLAFLDIKFRKFAESAGFWQTLAGLLEGVCGRGECAALSGTLHYYAGDLVKAVNALDEAQKLLGNNGDILALELEGAMRLGNVSKAIELENKLIAIAEAPQSKADRYIEMALILLHADREKEALAALEQAVAHGSTEQCVFDLRCMLYEKTGDEEALAQAWEKRIAQEQKKGCRDYLVWQYGRALNRNQAFAETMALFQTETGTLCRWQKLLTFERAAKDEEQIRFLDAWLQTETDERMKNAIVERLVMLLVERLDRPEIALKYVNHASLPKLSFGRVFMRQLLLETLGQYEELCESYLYMARETGDSEDAKMWLMEASGIADTLLHKPERAMMILKGLHDAAPEFVPAVEYYHHLALRTRDYQQVMIANAWRCELWPEDASAYAAENAWCAYELEDIDKAVGWFKRASAHPQMPARTLRAYIRLLKQCGRFDEAVKVIDKCVPLEAIGSDEKISSTEKVSDDVWDEEVDTRELDEENAVSAACPEKPQRLIGICMDEADRLSMRQAVLDMKAFCGEVSLPLVEEREKLFYLSPSVRRFLPYILELLANMSRERQSEAILKASAQLDCQDEEVKSLILWLRAELIMRDGENDQSSVDLMLRSCLERAYGNGLRAEVLRRLRQKNGGNVSEWLEHYASVTQDRWIATELLREASLRDMWIERDMDSARRTSLAAFKNSGNEWRSLWELERFADWSEDFQALGVLREKMAQIEPEAQARLQALKSALAPYVDDDLHDHAIRVAQDCLKLDPHEFTALLTLAQIAEEKQNRSALAGVADRLSEASCCQENKLSYGLWAARLWQGLGRSDQAFNSLTSLLAADPACMPAIAMSEQLLEASANWEKLSLVYVRAISALDEGRQQIELLRKHARILTEKMDDPAGASLALARILAQAPDDLDALTEQTTLLSQQSRWSEAVETLELRIRCTTTAEDKRTANIALADILIHRVGDLNRARRLLKRHLTQFVHDLEALRLMYDIACAERNWDDARQTLDEICQDVSPLMHWAKLAYTRIAREAEWTNEVRVVYERQAIDAVMGCRDELETLIEDYKTHGDLERLIRVAKYDLSKSTDAHRVAQYRGCVAALYVANGQHREALAFLSDVIADSEQTDWAYLARAQALASAGQFDSSAAEFRRTLTKNLALDQAYMPFIEVLRQLGDRVALAAAQSFVSHRLGERLEPVSCLSGTPRGFFDIELLPIEREYHEAFQYLRLMSPYIYPVYESAMKLQPLDPKNWAVTRCRQLFGQNMQHFDAHVYVSALGRRMATVRLTDPPALIMDGGLVQSPNPEFDFWAAYAMHQATSGGALLDAMDDAETEALFRALCDASPESVRAQALKKLIAKKLPRSDRKLFKDGVPFKSPAWAGFRKALDTRAACVAAILSASPNVALTAFPDDEELQRFILSDTYVRLLKLYWR